MSFNALNRIYNENHAGPSEVVIVSKAAIHDPLEEENFIGVRHPLGVSIYKVKPDWKRTAKETLDIILGFCQGDKLDSVFLSETYPKPQGATA